MSFLDRFFPKEVEQDSRGGFEMFSAPKIAEYKTKGQQLKAYESNEWVFSGAKYLARSVSRCKLRLFKVSMNGGREVKEEVFKAEPLDALMKNRGLLFREFLFLSTLTKTLTGEAMFKIDQIDFSLVFPKQTEMEVVGEDRITSYRYKGRSLPIEEVIHVREPSPSEFASVVSPLMPASETISSDNEAKQYSKVFFANNATPNGILELAKMKSVDFKKWVRGFFSKNSGVQNAHKIHITDIPVKFHNTSSSQKDMQFIEQGTASMKRILAVIGTPKEKVGDVSDANRANMDSIDSSLQKEVVLPELLILQDALSVQYLQTFPQYSEGYVFEFDDPTPENFSDMLKKRQIDGNLGIITANELREEDGREAIEGGDVLLNSISEVEVEKEDSAKKTTEDKKKRSIRTDINFSDKEKNEIERKYLNRFDKRETKLRNLAKNMFKDQEGRFQKKLKKAFGVRKDVILGDLMLELKVEEEIFQESIFGALNAIYKEEGASALEEVGVEEVFNIDDPKVRKEIEKQSQSFAKLVNNKTFSDLKEELNAGLKEGESYKELSKRVQGIFKTASKGRADNIAITETNTASNTARLESYSQAEFERKQWKTNLDGKERDAHRKANGQIVKIKEKFSVGGEKMKHPSDRSSGASAGNVCRCRCFVLPR